MKNITNAKTIAAVAAAADEEEAEKKHTKTLYVNLFVFAIKENIQALAFFFSNTNTVLE